MTLIIHVTESFGGGVAYAIRDYVNNSSSHEHGLLFSVRGDSALPKSEFQQFSFHTEFRDGALNRIKDIRRIAKQFPEAIFHAHSSWAGLYLRLALSSRRRTLYYTPHCFAFERLDVSRINRLFFRSTEKVLSKNVTKIVACSLREARLSAGLNAPTHYVPNVLPKAQLTSFISNKKIVAAGRIGQQKDPLYFINFVKAYRSIEPSQEFMWVGGGDDNLESALTAENIEVTGWCTREDAQNHIKQSALYVHTAAWEGFPLAILDAISVGTPVVARRIPAFEGEGFVPLADTAHELARLATEVLKHGRQQSATEQHNQAEKLHSLDYQRQQLELIYK